MMREIFSNLNIPFTTEFMDEFVGKIDDFLPNKITFINFKEILVPEIN
jgi:hypothetical protein